jgi:hypothetical protein
MVGGLLASCSSLSAAGAPPKAARSGVGVKTPSGEVSAPPTPPPMVVIGSPAVSAAQRKPIQAVASFGTRF